MDKIIQKIIDSERSAQNLIEEARQEQRFHEDKMRSEIAVYRKLAFEENDKKIAVFTESQNAEAANSVRSIESAAKKRISYITTIAEARRSDWIDHLFQKIMDGEIG